MKKDVLVDLLIEYHHDQELNKLKDILDYLQNKPVYIYTTIKISKNKLLQIPQNDIIMILNNLVVLDNQQYFAIFSSKEVTYSKRYCLEIKILDCLKLLKKISNNQIIINPKHKYSLILDNEILKYLKER